MDNLYTVELCSFMENEQRDFTHVKTVGEFPTYEKANEFARDKANSINVAAMCAACKSDGIVLDVVDRFLEEGRAVTSYELEPGLPVDVWYESDCHDFTYWEIVA